MLDHFVVGVRESGLDRGWPDTDAAWLRTPEQPWWFCWWFCLWFCWLLRWGSSGFQERDPVVGARAANRLRQRDVASHLPPGHGPGELPDALDESARARSPPSGWPRALSPPDGLIGSRPSSAVSPSSVAAPALPGGKSPTSSSEMSSNGAKRVVDLGDVHALRAEARPSRTPRSPRPGWPESS